MRGIKSLQVMAIAAAMTGGFGMESEIFKPETKPINKGRRAEKDATKLAKAEVKRQRRAAKRLTYNN